jgi:hypothetical protein
VAFAGQSPDWESLAKEYQPALFTFVSDLEGPHSMFFDGFFSLADQARENRILVDKAVIEASYTEAAKLYKAAVEVSPERISLLANYEIVLIRLNRLAEADPLGIRILEMRALYQ